MTGFLYVRDRNAGFWTPISPSISFLRWWVDGLKLGVMHRSRVVSGMGSSGDTGQWDRGLGGRDQGGVGPAAAAAAQDTAGQVGGSGGDHAACAQRQSGRNGRRTAACVRSLGYGISMDFAVSGKWLGVMR